MSGNLISAWSCSDQCIDVGKALLCKLNNCDNVNQIEDGISNGFFNKKMISKDVLKTKSLDEIQHAVFSLVIFLS